jgi:pheromone shutdown protein TraB
MKPKDIALELDWRRFTHFNTACLGCLNHRSCTGICEFTSATEALGNINANIWLIDMTEQEMRNRIWLNSAPLERVQKFFPKYNSEMKNQVQLWEDGFKERVINNSKKQIEYNRKLYPSLWRVLIDERNTLMAVRLARIISKNLNDNKHSKILTFVGAIHVEGIRELLMTPLLIKENLKKFKLYFSEPTLIRRVTIQTSNNY